MMHFRFLWLLAVLECLKLSGVQAVVHSHWMVQGSEQQFSFVLGQCCSAMACSATGCVDSVAGLRRVGRLRQQALFAKDGNAKRNHPRAQKLEQRVAMMSIYARSLLRNVVLFLGFQSMVMRGLLPLIHHGVRPFWFLLGQWTGQVVFGSMEDRFQLHDRRQVSRHLDSKMTPSTNSFIRQEEQRQMWKLFVSSVFSCACLLISQMVE